MLRTSVTQGGALPLIHTTTSYHLKKFQETNKLIATECDVFKPDRLSYFFVGRPAYKYQGDGPEAEYWELPCCFVFEFEAVTNITRVFPFDSGAFANRRYPSYINRMDLSNFEVNSAPHAASRIIGAFFGDTRSYFHLKGKDGSTFEKEFHLEVFDAELKALHRLANEKLPASFDDRRFTIEMQSSNDVDLTVTNPLAVIVPLPYFDNQNFLGHVQSTWKAVPIGYPMYTLSVSGYYYAIYERVEAFFKSRGIL